MKKLLIALTAIMAFGVALADDDMDWLGDPDTRPIVGFVFPERNCMGGAYEMYSLEDMGWYIVEQGFQSFSYVEGWGTPHSTCLNVASDGYREANEIE